VCVYLLCGRDAMPQLFCLICVYSVAVSQPTWPGSELSAIARRLLVWCRQVMTICERHTHPLNLPDIARLCTVPDPCPPFSTCSPIMLPFHPGACRLRHSETTRAPTAQPLALHDLATTWRHEAPLAMRPCHGAAAPSSTVGACLWCCAALAWLRCCCCTVCEGTTPVAAVVGGVQSDLATTWQCDRPAAMRRCDCAAAPSSTVGICV
jgi:hypothetical protein